MAHGITKKDSMMSVHKTPWHGLGVVLKRRPKSIQEALKKSGLDWGVDQKPVYLRGAKLLEGYKANLRRDTGDVLGVVSDEYQVVQNRDAFVFVGGLIGSELHFETAGSLWGGKAVWVLAQAPDHLLVGGDPVRQFVLITTRHDGTAGVRVKLTPTRVVCNNTLTAALGQKTDTYTVKHVGDMDAKLGEARRVLNLTIDYGKQFARFGNKLASQKITERKLAKVCEELWPGEGTDRQVKNAQARREAVAHLFLEGDTIGNAPGSKWCAWNALIEFDQHVRRSRTPQSKFLRAVEDPNGFGVKALELVRAA